MLRHVAAVFWLSAVLWYSAAMENKGKFKKGERRGKSTEFKKGQHWRPHQQYWDKKWLVAEYIEKQRSTGDIAAEVDCTDANIIFWLRKHKIPRRSIGQARAIKHWGLEGEANPMHSKRGSANHNWKGGCTPERQSFYTSEEWAKACSAVWKRDKARCQRCQTRREDTDKLHVHHIVPFAVKEFRAEVSNLVLLCTTCHRWVHSKRNIERLFIRDKS